jgi:hypothetical protein
LQADFYRVRGSIRKRRFLRMHGSGQTGQRQSGKEDNRSLPARFHFFIALGRTRNKSADSPEDNPF